MVSDRKEHFSITAQHPPVMFLCVGVGRQRSKQHESCIRKKVCEKAVDEKRYSKHVYFANATI